MSHPQQATDGAATAASSLVTPAYSAIRIRSPLKHMLLLEPPGGPGSGPGTAQEGGTPGVRTPFGRCDSGVCCTSSSSLGTSSAEDDALARALGVLDLRAPHSPFGEPPSGAAALGAKRPRSASDQAADSDAAGGEAVLPRKPRSHSVSAVVGQTDPYQPCMTQAQPAKLGAYFAALAVQPRRPPCGAEAAAALMRGENGTDTAVEMQEGDGDVYGTAAEVHGDDGDAGAMETNSTSSRSSGTISVIQAIRAARASVERLGPVSARAQAAHAIGPPSLRLQALGPGARSRLAMALVDYLPPLSNGRPRRTVFMRSASLQ